MRVHIREALAATGTSQAELARQLGVGDDWISRVMTGRAQLTAALYARALAVLDYQYTLTIAPASQPADAG